MAIKCTYNPQAIASQQYYNYTRWKDNRRLEAAYQRMASASRINVNPLPSSRQTEESSSSPTYTVIDFHEAIERGDEQEVRKALALRKDMVNRFCALHRKTPLHIAAEKGYGRIVSILISAGADIEAKDHAGRTPLSAATVSNQSDAVSKLLEAGANPDNPNNQGETPLFFAANKASFIIFSMLAGKSKNLDAVRVDDTTAFIIAAYGPDAEKKMNFLYKAGVNVHKKSKEDFSAFHSAAEAGIQSWVEFFVGSNTPVDLRTKKGFTPLLFAAKRGHLNLVRSLQRAGADMMAVTQQGWSVVHFAALGNSECLEHVLSIRNDPNGKTAEGFTPLHLVAMMPKNKHSDSNSVGKASLLLQHGAEVNALASNILKFIKNNQTTTTAVTHWTPLHHAAFHNDLPLIGFLLQNGADKEIEDSSGCTPHAYAKRLGFKEAEQLLLQAAKTRSYFACIIC